MSSIQSERHMSVKKLYCEICSKKFPVDVSVMELVTHLSTHRKYTLERFILTRCFSEIFKTGVQSNHAHTTNDVKEKEVSP